MRNRTRLKTVSQRLATAGGLSTLLLLLGLTAVAPVALAVGGPNPQQLTLVAGGGSTAPSTTAEAATAAQLNGPSGLAVDSSGDRYIADTNDNEVDKVTPAGSLTVFAGGGGTSASSSTAFAATTIGLAVPEKVAVDGSGNVYIADSGDEEVDKVTPTGSLTLFAGGGGSAPSTTARSATSVNIEDPTGVAVDGSGNVYVADAGRSEVYKVTAAGSLTVFAGGGSTAPTTTPATATSATLDAPDGVAVNTAGTNVYIADTEGSATHDEIEEVTSAGLFVIAGGGTQAPSATPQTATTVQLGEPYDVAVDPSGNVYVADAENGAGTLIHNEVEEVTTSGSLTVVAGSGSAAASTTAHTATTISLADASGVAVDGSGNLYIADAGNGTSNFGEIDVVTPLLTVTSVAPAAGPAAGATSVTVTGTDFSGATAVHFGATAATGVTVVSPTSITAVAPAGTGVVDVTVTTPSGGTSATSAADQFTYDPLPTVTGVSPSAGPLSTVDAVTITGTGFVAGSTVKFGTVAGSVSSVVSSTTITARSRGVVTAGVVDVTVTTPGGTSAVASGDHFAFEGVPTVTGLSPAFGPAAGGTVVTVTGTGLTGVTSVRFGATAAGAMTVLSATSLTATAPAGTGVADVTVTTTSGTSAVVAADRFSYAPTVTAISPASGPAAGGTIVRVTGTGFTGATAVKFGATAATNLSHVTATSLTATAPAGTGTADVKVTTPSGTSVVVVADQFGYVLTATTTTLSAPTSAVFGTALTLTANVAPVSGPSGTVSFTDTANGSVTVLGSGVVNSGVASWTGPLPAVGANSIVAAYGGDATFASSSSAASTVTVSATSHLLVVSQLRFSGPNGASDSYVELQNQAADPLSLAGWSLVTSAGSNALQTSVTLPPDGSYLLAGSAYSLGSVAAPDQVVALADGVEVVAPDATVADAVGDTSAASGFSTGTPLVSIGGSVSTQYAFVRHFVAGAPTASDDNAADFTLVSLSGGPIGSGSAVSALGTPSPQDSSSPVTENSVLSSALLDTGVAAGACPNRCYVPGSPGLLTVSRTITNTSQTSSFSSVVVRITSLSEANGAPEPGVGVSPARHAVLAVTDPAASTSQVLLSDGDTVTVDNLSPDAPAVVPPGGGLGTTLTVPLSAVLGPSQSVNVSLTFAVDQGGPFWVGYNVDGTVSAAQAPDSVSGRRAHLPILSGSDHRAMNRPAFPASVVTFVVPVDRDGAWSP